MKTIERNAVEALAANNSLRDVTVFYAGDGWALGFQVGGELRALAKVHRPGIRTWSDIGRALKFMRESLGVKSVRVDMTGWGDQDDRRSA